MRSALLEVPGVTRVQAELVDLNAGQATVTFDPRVVAVEALVAAVDRAEGPVGPKMYRAGVKEGPRPASTR